MTTGPTFDELPFPAALLDEARCIVQVNASWGQHLERQGASLGIPFDTLISKRDPQGQRAFCHGLATTSSFSLHARLSLSQGEVLTGLRLHRQAVGWFLQVEVLSAESPIAQLLFERQRWRAVLASATDGIAVLDEDGRFIEVNARFLDLLQPRTKSGLLLDDQGILGRTFEEVVTPDIAQAWGTKITDTAVRTPTQISAALVAGRSLALTLSPTILSGGVRSGVCVIVRDRSVEEQLTSLYEELSASSAFLNDIYKVMPGALFITDGVGIIQNVNDAAAALLGEDTEHLVGRSLSDRIEAPGAIDYHSLEATLGDGQVLREERHLIAKGGERVPVLLCVSFCDVMAVNSPSAERRVVHVAIDIRERKRLEIELRQNQKLESVGRLAAGVAHEINTPVQFVSDSVHFTRDAVGDLLTVIEKLQAVQRSVLDGVPSKEAADDADQAAEAADLPYLKTNLPKALERALDGLGRVATIVRSMKEFAHPDTRDMTAIDLNRAIESTLAIARHEYKYVADVETDFEELPQLECYAGDINQAVLNIVVNAAHAIGDVAQGIDRRGRISVRTRREGDQVCISISDTGGGIPEQLRDRIFDPFFTTKEVGKGTGQGLAICRSVIVDRHRGQLTFETELGKGTTFHIRLPFRQLGRPGASS